jgi:cell division protein FtsN
VRTSETTSRFFKVKIIADFLCGMVLPLALCSTVLAQEIKDEIKSYIDKLEKGEAEQVKQVLPELVAKYQTNPGVIYLQGRLTSNGVEAVKSYQSIVENFPQSEWADDALFRIYQYYYAIGLYHTAELKMQQLKKYYPASPYVTGKTEVKLPQKDEEMVALPRNDTVQASVPPHATTQPDMRQSTSQLEVAAGQYTLQVGAFSTIENAEKQKRGFEELGYSVEIKNKVRSGRSLYLVWVKSFKNAEEAKRFGKEVKAKYKIDSIVVERY